MGTVRTLACEFLPFIDATRGSLNARRNSGSPEKYYDYLYSGAVEVKPGDMALVHNGTDFGLVKVHRIKPGISDKVTKYVIKIVTKADMEAYLENNQRIQEHRKVFDELEGLLKAEDELTKYRRLAETNPRAKELLEQVLGFGGATLEDKRATPVFTEELAKIPEDVVYVPNFRDFFNTDGQSMGVDFFNRWIARVASFPQKINPVNN